MMIRWRKVDFVVAVHCDYLVQKVDLFAETIFCTDVIQEASCLDKCLIRYYSRLIR